ncbi:MAG TPA: NACHT domain-containing protein [Actinocrinis sp.]|nr:NACHT domain-containing protein [Actinocrinis sp.]
MFEEVIVGALGNILADVLSATARQLGILRRRIGERRRSADLDLATWFDAYKLTDELSPEFAARLHALLPNVDADAFVERLKSDRSHAVLHELLAARLTDAPERQLLRLRESLDRALRPTETLRQRVPTTAVDFAFDYFDEHILDMLGRLREALPEAVSQLRDRAAGHRIIAILDAIERHQVAAADGDHETDVAFLERYRRHLITEFGRITPPDLEQRRRIPIEALYVPPNIAPVPPDTGESAVAQPDRPPSRALLGEFAESIERTVLLGDPGAGKTAAARALMHANAREHAGTAFLVTVRDFAAEEPVTHSVARYIEHVIDTAYQCAPPQGWVRRQLLDGAALVIFDGLDELVDTSRRAQVSSVIEHFCIEYPLVRVLVTSRFVGYDQARLDDEQFVRHRVDRFDDKQVADYARKWFACDGTLTPAQAADDAAAFVAESKSVPDLRRNPLMLSLMCVLYRGEGYIPQHRAQVYRLCADLLFHRWDASRHIHVALTLTQSQVKRLLRGLAYWLLTRQDSTAAVTERELIDKTTQMLLDRDIEQAPQAEAAAAEFVDFCRGRGWIFVDVGATARGEPLYAFAHRTFLEYFAAAHLAATTDTPEALAHILLPRVTRAEWDITAQLAIAMKDEASEGGGARVLAALFADRRYTSAEARGRLLMLAATCVDSVDVPPSQIKALTQRILDLLLEPAVDTDLKDAVLGWTLQSVRRCRETVAAEFTARAEQLVASDDLHSRATGYFLAAFHRRSNTVEIEPSNLEYWDAWAVSNAHRWHDRIEQDAVSDQSVLHLAVSQGVLSLAKALMQPAGFARVVQSSVDPVVGHDFASILMRAAFRMRLAPASNVADLERCRELGEYLLAHAGPPPWTASTGWYITPVYLYGGVELTAAHAGGYAEPVYLAVSVLTALEVESRMAFESRQVTLAAVSDSATPSGWLNAFVPYILARLGENAAPREPLPVREDYQRLFERWARGEVDFTVPRSTATAAAGP